MNFLMSRLRRLAFAAWSRFVRRDLRGASACHLFGLDLVIAPGVLHPRHFASSRVMAEYLLAQDLSGITLADLGTGSGLLGLIAARGGATVSAIDINPASVVCARENAARNGLGDRVQVVLSDVLQALPAEARFDLIVTNPPFYPRTPRDLPDHAFAAGDRHRFFEDLAADLPGRLSARGSLLVVHSSDTDFAPIATLLESRGLAGSVVLVRRGFFETLTVRRFARGAFADRSGPLLSDVSEGT